MRCAAVMQYCCSDSDTQQAGDGAQDAAFIEIRVRDSPKTCTAVRHTGECIFTSLQLMFWIEAEVLAVVASHYLNLRNVLSADTSLW